MISYDFVATPAATLAATLVATLVATLAGTLEKIEISGTFLYAKYRTETLILF